MNYEARGQHQVVEQFGAGSRAEGVRSLLESALELAGLRVGICAVLSSPA
jgi:hypothetical protein